ncbi:MAG: hypothetical protein L0221_16705 [Chloroflexi bacterium]|nr:hypothetical protein [Chloroflexota bacterium]
MSRERDSEFVLREWVSEGAERAPDWAVSSALAEIARTPQRRAWRTHLLDAERRLGRAARLLEVAAVVVLLVVPLALVRLATVGIQTDRTIVLDDLASIVVWQDTMPSGWTLDSLTTTGDAVALIPVRTMPALEFLASPALDGLQGGRYTDFSGTDAVFMSWSVLFSNSRQAGVAFEAYATELESASGWGLGAGRAIDLGDQAALFTGETHALLATEPTEDLVPMQLYLWRVENVVLATAGWFEYDPDELREVADGMDARAR